MGQSQRSFTGMFFGINFVAVSAIALSLLRSGYKLRH
jgi:hypothetical protein